jgi:predicted nucleic-acid-binding protein
VIALDTNVIARFYVDDPSDPAALKQRPAARRIFESGTPLYIPLTVVLELEWVLRAFYGFGPPQFARVLQHLAGLPHATIESEARVLAALQHHGAGLDFADALHLGASLDCQSMMSFDDRRFARKAARLQLHPPVRVPD